jgi:sporulation protein YlmC with PRC-barrel domain
MSPDGAIKLVSELLDLPLIDSDGKFCGIVDDVELAGSPGKALTIKAILAGPGAYAGRMPRWALGLVRLVAGNRITRVPWAKVRSIGSAVQLDCPANALGLDKSENRAGRWIPRKGAL